MIKSMKKIDSQFISKCITAVHMRLLYFNIRNANVQNLAYTEFCYKKLKKKYKKLLFRHNTDVKEQLESEYVWICWFQGIENAPNLVKACYKSVKKYMPNKKIILLTEKNYTNYISFPKHIVDRINKKLIPYACLSDLIRLELLDNYGGIWIDSTVFLTEKPSILYNKKYDLFVFKNISLYRKQQLAVVASSWLIKSEQGNPIIRLTKELMYEYWKNYNRLIIYSLIHVMFSLATEVYDKEWEKVPSYSNIPPHILQFELLDKYNSERFNQIKKMSNIHKLNHRIVTSNKDTNYYHIISDMELDDEK